MSNILDFENDFNYKGVYDNTKTYYNNDVIYYNNASYLSKCTILCGSNYPDDNDDWVLLTSIDNYNGSTGDSYEELEDQKCNNNILFDINKFNIPKNMYALGYTTSNQIIINKEDDTCNNIINSGSFSLRPGVWMITSNVTLQINSSYITGFGYGFSLNDDDCFDIPIIDRDEKNIETVTYIKNILDIPDTFTTINVKNSTPTMFNINLTKIYTITDINKLIYINYIYYTSNIKPINFKSLPDITIFYQATRIA